MEVTQKDDHITHAVAGKHETIEMSMSSSAALMHIMSAALYTHPELATVREPICNAWDAHISAGKQDTNLVIEVNERSFSVQDFGFGIPHNKIGAIYGTYGDSTKRDDSTVTGGFGLGSKAPFAYTDLFEVVSCNEGTKTIYRVSKSSMEKGGKPAIHKVVDMPTLETGITVSFGLKPGDKDKFLRLVKEVVQLGGIKATINEGVDDVITLPLEESPTGYIIHSLRGTVLDTVNLRYGNVVYPVPERAEYAAEMRIVERAMGNLWRGAKIIFMAAPNTVSIAPSRENLILTDGTIETIKKALGQFDDKMLEQVDITNHQNANAVYNKAYRDEPMAESYSDLVRVVQLKADEDQIFINGDMPYAFTLKQACQKYYISRLTQNRDYQEESHSHLSHLRVKKVLEARKGNLALGNALVKMMKREKSKEFQSLNHRKRRGLRSANECVKKYVMYPLHKEVKANSKMNLDRLSYVSYVGWNGASLSKFKDCHFDTNTALQFLFPKVLIASNVKSIDTFFNRLRRNSDHNDNSCRGWMVYRTATPATHIEAAIQAFTKLGYEVTCIANAPVKKEVDPNTPVQKKVAKKAKAKKHNLSLKQAFCPNSGTYLLSQARKNEEGDCVDPVAWVILKSKSSYTQHNKRLPGLSAQQSSVVFELLGDRIAVVTAAQAEVLKVKGVVSVQEMITKYVADRLVSRPDFPSYVAYGAHVAEQEAYASGVTASRWGLMLQMCAHKQLMDSLGLRFHISAETALLVQFVEDDRGITEFCTSNNIAQKVKPSPMIKKVYDLLENSAWAPFVNIRAVKDALANASEELAMDSIPVKLMRELLPFKKLHSKQVAT